MKVQLDDYVRKYLSEGQEDLIQQGMAVLEFMKSRKDDGFKDYSFVVFPFAKAYEGFLKQVFYSAGFIPKEEYMSKHFRVGQVLSPNLVNSLGDKSVYKKVCDHSGCDLGERMWQTWRTGRNQVFHYFPHNVQSLGLEEAEKIIQLILNTMRVVVESIHLGNLKQKMAERMSS